MAVSKIVVALILTLSPWAAQSRRVVSSAQKHDNTQVANEDAEVTEATENCCCKKDYCGDNAKGKVYSPNYGLCCRYKTWGCGNILNGWRTSYKIEAASTAFCESPQSERFGEKVVEPIDEVVDEEPLRPVEDLQEGTPEHTVQSYCSFDENDELEDEEASVESTPASQAKNSIVKALVSELDKNSLDSMAKDMFSMYVCVRWAPTKGFVKAGDGEMQTKQLEEGKSVYEHFDAFTFIPLRCSKNINVYGNKPELGATHFDKFEAEMMRQSAWQTTEAGGVVAKRLQDMQDHTHEELEEAAKAFDVATVRKKVAACQTSGPIDTNSITVDTVNAPASELLNDCAAAQWWLEKIEDWNAAMPFTSFMSPTAEVAKGTKPASNEHVLVCFGKRVSSQLHRRAEGGHLITDQSMVGCHGFWKFDESAAMLERIVKLWRPPTCQLASMELDMKVKMMELISTMNEQLFDALPAMLDDESSSNIVDEEGNPLHAATAPGIFMGLAKSVGSLFSSMSSKYVRLGQMLGGTTVKWVVCPLKPIVDPEKLRKLDMALGTEDKLAQHYAKTAYAKWTGAKNLLPGEECTAYEAVEGAPAMPRANLKRCSVAEMSENTPEPYRDEKFICPTRPLLPAKQQLQVLQKKKDVCPLRLDFAQQKGAAWLYYGRKPHTKQYDVMQNFPSNNNQAVKILDFKTRYDSLYYVTRTFVTIGRGCTEEEAAATPRFCTELQVANKPSIARDLLTGAAIAGQGAVSGAAATLRLAGVMEAVPANKAYGKRIAGWLSGQAKSVEKYLRSGTDATFGRSSGRYEKLHKRSFAEVEANELMHSVSFQSQFDDTGSDSKHNKKFDRFAVVAPCVDFDPNKEFRLKYSWSEKSITLARKAFQKVSSGGFGTSSRAVKVQLRSDAVLRMEGKEAAYINYFAHFRGANVGGNFEDGWMKTSNPHVLDMAGIFDGSSDSSFSVDDLLGYEATYACGTRVEMHDLDGKFDSLSGSFKDCVKQGKESNKALREASPDKPFLKDEVVIRVTMKSLDSCHMSMADTIPAEEKVNPVYVNFAKTTGCSGPSDTSLSKDLKGAKGDKTFRGMVLGAGLPSETLLELLVDPADFMQEVTL